MTGNITITIGRQLGSGGSYIGRLVAERMGINYIDREVLRQVADLLHESEESLSDREERISTFWERMARAFCYGTPETGYSPPPLRSVPDEELFAAESRIIREITRERSCVLVGRAGFHILRDRPNLAKVFVFAPREFRVRRVMELYDIADAHRAGEIVDDADRQRGRFARVMTGGDWSDCRNYHLCMDTGAVGFQAAAEMVLRLVEGMGRNPGRG